MVKTESKVFTSDGFSSDGREGNLQIISTEVGTSPHLCILKCVDLEHQINVMNSITTSDL